MRKLFLLVALGWLISVPAALASECPDGKVPVTFKYVPLPGEEVPR